jgi:uncharacterized BrkB/YihY/UPF0761 family membrane protein
VQAQGWQCEGAVAPSPMRPWESSRLWPRGGWRLVLIVLLVYLILAGLIRLLPPGGYDFLNDHGSL